MIPSTEFNQESSFEKQQIGKQLSDQTNSQSQVISVIEEQVKIDKRVVEKGSVLVLKKVHQEEVTIDVPLIYEEHAIERVAVNEYVDTPPSVRYEGDTMIIPVLREEVIVEKRLLLVEELRITKREVQNNFSQQVTLRKEEVSVDRISNEQIDVNANF